MYNRSPLLNDCFNGPKAERSPKVDALTARISSILNTMDRPIKSSAAVAGLPVQRPFRKSEELIVSELQRIQEVITDLIALFQDYRFSIDNQLERLCVEVATVDIKMQMQMDAKIKAAKESILQEFENRLDKGLFNRAANLEVIRSTVDAMNLGEDREDQIAQIHAEMDVIRQAEIEIVEKINAISSANAECHQASDHVFKCLRDVINQPNR